MRRDKNLVAKDLHSKKYRQRVIPDKREKKLNIKDIEMYYEDSD